MEWGGHVGLGYNMMVHNRDHMDSPSYPTWYSGIVGPTCDWGIYDGTHRHPMDSPTYLSHVVWWIWKVMWDVGWDVCCTS